MPKSFSSLVLVGACTGVIALAGCSSNDGGETTCKDFRSADKATQSEMVSSMLKDKSGSEPSNAEVSLTKMSVQAFCATAGKDSSTISQIDGS